MTATGIESRPSGTRRGAPAPRQTQRVLVQVLLNLGKGGMESMAVRLAVALARRGHRPVIIALDAGGEHEEILRAAGVTYHVLGGRKRFDPRFHARLARLLRSERASVVHTHHFATLLHTLLAAKIAGVRRLVHTEHSFQYLRPRADYRLALRLMSWSSDAFVVVGHAMESFYRHTVRVPGDRLTVVLNGVDASGYARPADAMGERARLGLPAGFLVGTAGRLFPEKDYGVLIRAVQIASTSLPDIQLALVGDGSERDALEGLVDELGARARVHFLGWRDDVAAILPLLDVFAMSSRHEGLPLVVLEAMASGLPIVSTPVGDLPMVLADGEAGLFFPIGEPRALADHLIALGRRAEMRSRLGAAASDRARRFYSHEEMVERYLELYAV